MILASDPSTASIQYIPESLVVYNAFNEQRQHLVKKMISLQLVEGTDYTVNWNENYTDFESFKDGTKKYYVTYNTTTPNDGSKV